MLRLSNGNFVRMNEVFDYSLRSGHFFHLTFLIKNSSSVNYAK